MISGGGILVSRGLFRLITYRAFACHRRLLINPISPRIFDTPSSSFSSVPIVDNRLQILKADRADEVLSCLKSRSSIPSITDEELINIPHLCVLTGRFGSFAKVYKKWSQRAKPIFDQMDYFNAAIILRHLGRINQRTNGDLIDRLSSLTPITYMMERMIKMGFDRFDAADVIKGLIGIQWLVMYGTGNRSEPIRDQFQFRSTLDLWVSELEKFILKKSISDSDYPTLIRQASTILCMLTRLNRSPSSELLRRLCEWSKTNFDRQLGFGSDTDQWDVHDVFQPRYFADAMLYQNRLIDPDQIVPGSWNSWYDLVGILMDDEMGTPDVIFDSKKIDAFRNSLSRYRNQSMTNPREKLPDRSDQSRDRLSFANARNVAAVTAVFADNPATTRNFWRIFPIWATFTKRVLTQISIRPRWNDRWYLPNFICSLGQLAENLRQNQEYRRFDLRFVVPLLEDVMIKVGAGCDHIGQSRSMIGFRDLKVGLDLDSFSFSDSFFGMLTDWCMEIRLDHKNLRNASNTAALLLYLFRDMRSIKSPPESILAELCHLFEWGIDHLNDQDLIRALPYLADACLYFRFDPTKSSESPNQSIGYNSDQNDEVRNSSDFWSKYFHKVRRHLEFDWSYNLDRQQKIKVGNYFLGLLPYLAVKFGGAAGHFRRLKRTYEERIKEIMPDLDPKYANMMAIRLRQLEISRGIEMDPEMIKGLERLAQDCNSKISEK